MNYRTDNRKKRQKTTHHQHQPHRSHFLSFAVPAVLLAIYLIGVFYYHSHFLPRTTINGTSVSSMSAAKAEGKLPFTLPSVSITLKDGTNKTFSLSDVGGSYSYTKQLQKTIKKQSALAWILPVGRALKLSPDLSYDESKISGVITSLTDELNKNAEAPQDAYIEKTDTGFSIMKEKEGSTLSVDKLVAKTEAALKEWNYTVDASECYEEPSVKESDLSLTDEMQAINSYDDLKVDMSGGVTVSIDKSTIMSWISYDSDSNTISVDSSAVAAYTAKLAEQYNTLGTVRKFKTHDGSTISVGGSEKDTLGYEMDQETTASRIAAAVLTGKETAARWPVAGFTRTEDNDFGTTYVEVSIAQQHLWYYENGAVVLETDVVTGEGENSTTPGVFMVLDKQSPAVLKGANYETPVDYWMPVTYTGTGLHDAKWRTSFGKEIYVSGGSHGCVNMPTEMAAELYGKIAMGTPVIIY